MPELFELLRRVRGALDVCDVVDGDPTPAPPAVTLKGFRLTGKVTKWPWPEVARPRDGVLTIYLEATSVEAAREALELIGVDPDGYLCGCGCEEKIGGLIRHALPDPDRVFNRTLSHSIRFFELTPTHVCYIAV